ncbi:SCAR/WAVE family [Parasponia andersonii]|uniref:Protein SCAR n=1 Tax=Parasponia andersonii TaxID=3476 RepID=A0A2P5BXT0_PARAD|nr:SCAR/WAVE family [Parasponia andersonii]
MPLTRYRVRSEYGLADPELYRAADKDDPEALLEGVAMAGLVGVLRQLGDLAEFAAEIFHNLHEEVMATAARGHGLMVRVQQLEAEFPPIEKALLSQTNHSSFFCNAGVDWHPNLRPEQNLVARGDLPRFVMDSYEESRGPPRLFLLDKFDVAGAGACLKRYTDPSFFKVEAAAAGIAKGEFQREKKNRRVKKKGSRWRNGETTPEVAPASHTKLHQLFLEERVENGLSDPARLVKLKKRQLNGSAIDSKTGKSYMEKFVETPPERELACETSVTPALLPSYASESGIRILEISTVSPAECSPRNASDCSSQSINGFDEEVVGREIIEVSDTTCNDETVKISSPLHEVQVEKQWAISGEGKTKGGINGYESDDMTSEVDNYVDALACMESEMETDNEYRPNSNLRFLKAETHAADYVANEEHHECRALLSDTQSVGNFSTSDDGNNSFKKNRLSFSYSDTPSSVVENTPSDCDGAAKVFPSEICGAEIVYEASNELPVTAQSLGAKDDEFVASHDVCIEKESIPDHGDASSGALLNDLYLTSLQTGPGASLLTTDSAEGPLVGGTPAEDIMLDSKVPDNVENGKNTIDSIAIGSRVSSQGNDDITKTSEIYLVNEVEDEDPSVDYDIVLHLPNDSELASGKESRESSVNEEFQTLDEGEDSNRSLVIGEIDSPFNSITEKQLSSSSLPVLDTQSTNSLLPNNFTASSDHSDVLVPHDMVSKVDGSFTTTEVNSEDLSPTLDIAKSHVSEEITSRVDSPEIPGLKEPGSADLSENLSHLEHVSAEAGVPDPEEIGLSRSCGDAIGGDVVSLQHPSSYLSGTDNCDLTEVDSVVDETVALEDVTVHSADSPETPGLKEPESADLSENLSHLDHVSAEAGVPDPEEIDLSRSCGDAIGGDVVSLQHSSSYLSSTDNCDLTEVDSVVDETVAVGDAAVHSADTTNIVDNISSGIRLPPYTECSPSNPTDLRESLFGFVVPQQQQVALDEVFSPECATESGTHEDLHRVEAAPSDLGLDTNIPVSYNIFGPNIAVAADDNDLSPAEKTQYSASAVDISAASTSSDLSDQESELRPSCDNYHVESTEDTVSLPTSYLPEAETPSEKAVKLQAEQVNTKDLQTDEAGPHPETPLEKSRKLQADQVGTDSVVTEEAGSHPEIPSKKSQVFCNQLDVECQQVDRASINSSNLPSEQMESLNQMGEETSEQIESPKHISQEIRADTSLQSCQEDLPSQSSISEFSSKSAGPEVDDIRQSASPSEFAPSSLVMLPETSQVDLGEMPPLPPLPPMQWRMGKFSQGLFPSIQPYSADEKAQADVPASHSGMQQPQHPFLPPTIVDNEKSLHVAVPLTSNLAQPPIYSMQLPTIVNDANTQYSYLALGGTQSLNPFLTLPVVSREGQGHGNLSLERETEESDSSFFSPTLTTQSTTGQNHEVSQVVSQPMNQVTPETGVETMIHEQSLEYSKGELGNPFVTSMVPPTVVDEQVRLGLLMPEGEKAWSSNNSSMMPDSEVEKPNGNPVNKLPRPRNPLIDAVNAHGKSKLRKVTERVRPQIGPKADERDSLLEQIRTKSFNLKPATVARPSIPGPAPKTNLKVAAILEKANAIRQALAGSDDEDDDEDNWSS